MKNTKQDKTTIGNTVAEINSAAKALNVDPIAIHVAKYLRQSNDREIIYKWIKDHMGDIMGIEIKLKEKKS